MQTMQRTLVPLDEANSQAIAGQAGKLELDYDEETGVVEGEPSLVYNLLGELRLAGIQFTAH